MRRLTALLLAAVVAAGCSLGEVLADHGDPVDMRPADLVGTWRGGTQRVITFAEDGGFTAEWLPYEEFHELAGARNGSGAFELSALRQGGRVLLFFFYVGPGGNSWTAYERCADCPSEPAPAPSPSLRASREAVPRPGR